MSYLYHAPCLVDLHIKYVYEGDLYCTVIRLLTRSFPARTNRGGTVPCTNEVFHRLPRIGNHKALIWCEINQSLHVRKYILNLIVVILQSLFLTWGKNNSETSVHAEIEVRPIEKKITSPLQNGCSLRILNVKKESIRFNIERFIDSLMNAFVLANGPSLRILLNSLPDGGRGGALMGGDGGVSWGPPITPVCLCH